MDIPSSMIEAKVDWKADARVTDSVFASALGQS